MKPLEVIILTPSDIISAGLGSIIASFKIAGLQIHRMTGFGNEQSDSLRHQCIAHNAPVLLIADTAIFPASRLTDFRDKYSGLVAAIGICHSTLPSETTAGFDTLLSIYSDAQMIKAELQKAIVAADNRREGGRAGGSDELTPREKEIIVSVVKGLSNKEIASRLSVSVNTVMTHRRNIASKLQIHSPAGLTIYAIVSKLVSIDQIKNHIG